MLPQYETVLIAAGPQIITCGFDPTQVLPWFLSPLGVSTLMMCGIRLPACFFRPSVTSPDQFAQPREMLAQLLSGPRGCPEAQLTWWGHTLSRSSLGKKGLSLGEPGSCLGLCL